VRIAILGHVEHIALGRVPRLPGPGEIAHVEDVRVFPGGGGGIAFFQVAKSDAEIHFFTAFGNDEAAVEVRSRVAETGARVHGASREAPHTRDVVLITPDGERTVIVLGEPLHPEFRDPLPWEVLASCDAAYFTAQDPEVLRAARSAKILVVTARRREAILRSGVQADAIVGSISDPRERAALRDFPVPPRALVMTEGRAGGVIETAAGISRFPAPHVRPPPGGGAYGAGDSFAGALTFYLAAGLAIGEACTRAGHHGAAVVGSLHPIESQLRLTRAS
jgi:ribokinase